MLDDFEMGMPQERIDTLFGEVQSALVPFIGKIRSSTNQPSLAPLSGRKFNIDAQKEASQKIVQALGYDESHGRIDVSGKSTLVLFYYVHAGVQYEGSTT